jgi:hypothetical protein
MMRFDLTEKLMRDAKLQRRQPALDGLGRNRLFVD